MGLAKVAVTGACVSVRVCKCVMLSKSGSFFAFPLRSPIMCGFSVCVSADLLNVAKEGECEEEPFPTPSSPTQAHGEQKRGIHFINGVNITALCKSHEATMEKCEGHHCLTWHRMRGYFCRDLLLSRLNSSTPVTCPLWQLIRPGVKLALGARQNLLTRSKFTTLRCISLCHLHKTTWSEVLATERGKKS